MRPGIGRNDGAVCIIERQESAFLDSGRRVADDILEAVILQHLDDLAYSLLGQGILVPGLGRGENIEIVYSLMPVLDEGLGKVAFMVNQVDEVINDTPLASHDQVEVAETDIKINYYSLMTMQGKSGAD